MGVFLFVQQLGTQTWSIISFVCVYSYSNGIFSIASHISMHVFVEQENGFCLTHIGIHRIKDLKGIFVIQRVAK